jgi:hypothetical protein
MMTDEKNILDLQNKWNFAKFSPVSLAKLSQVSLQFLAKFGKICKILRNKFVFRVSLVFCEIKKSTFISNLDLLYDW